MGILLFDSIVKDGAINLENYRNVYSADVNWKALTNTVELSLMVMIASVIITFPLAWLIPAFCHHAALPITTASGFAHIQRNLVFTGHGGFNIEVRGEHGEIGRASCRERV